MEELNRKSVDEFKGAEKLSIVVVLENIRSAYNVGSVFRTSDAFLLEAIYLVGYTCVPPHKEIKKTALGAEDSVQWEHFTSSGEAIEKLHQMGYKIYAAEQSLLMTKGLPRRPWYKHSLYAPGFYTGYGVKTIPGVREAIEQKDWSETRTQIEEVAAAINRLANFLETL
jgi:hypothetical protein